VEQRTAVGDRAEQKCIVTLWNNAPLSVTAPNHVVLAVTETDPGIRGDTATGGVKPATLETGAVVKVPLFVEIGDLLARPMVDDWRPRATQETLRARAVLLAAIRAFFTERDLLEVETPQLSTAATSDPVLASLATRWPGPDGPPRFLHTSPELPMKRLLAAGSGDIWQLARVFRDGERGRLHHPASGTGSAGTSVG
jgi:hypothetical protein